MEKCFCSWNSNPEWLKFKLALMLRFNGYSAIQIIHKIFQPLIDASLIHTTRVHHTQLYALFNRFRPILCLFDVNSTAQFLQHQ